MDYGLHLKMVLDKILIIIKDQILNFAQKKHLIMNY
jgi:hypothetical protein